MTWNGFNADRAIALIPIDLMGNAIHARWLFWPARRPTAAGAGTSSFTAAIYKAILARPHAPEAGQFTTRDMEVKMISGTKLFGHATGAGTEIAAGGQFAQTVYMTPDSLWFIGCSQGAPASHEYMCPQNNVSTGASGTFAAKETLNTALDTYDALPDRLRPRRILSSYLPLFTLLSQRGLYQFATTQA